jgi:hypothetical protein
METALFIYRLQLHVTYEKNPNAAIINFRNRYNLATDFCIFEGKATKLEGARSIQIYVATNIKSVWWFGIGEWKIVSLWRL